MKNEKVNLATLKDQISLRSLLEALGHYPKGSSGGELFYISMLRDNDRTPSFCVNENLGFWYDHGLGKGGTVIDFAMHYWPELSFREAMEKLQHIAALPASQFQQSSRTEAPLRIPSYQIKESRPLGSNLLIRAYLNSRGILPQAQGIISELYYFTSRGEEKKQRYAAAWQNRSEGWEVRNEFFKGCLGKKDLSVFYGSENHVAVFEGLMDYLSYKREFPSSEASVIVLNSVSLLSKAVELCKEKSSVELFFDHDAAGKKATVEFLAAVPTARDRSTLYEGHADYNSKIMALDKQSRSWLQNIRGYRSKGTRKY